MKFLIILILSVVIFGSGAYFTWVLFWKKQQLIAVEKGQPPPPPPPDPTLADFTHCQQLEESSPLPVVRDAWRDFVSRYPQSSKIEPAKARLGQINSALLFSSAQTPDKTVYTVKPNDVIGRVAARAKTTPELIMRLNNLDKSMLRIGQQLVMVEADFSLQIDRRHQWVTLQQGGKFFRQYPILTMPVHGGHPVSEAKAPEHKAGPTPRPPKVVAKVTDKVAWLNGVRVMFSDKGFQQSSHWILVAPAGHSLYTESGMPVAAGAGPPQKPPGGGYGLAADAIEELAALLRKNDSVTID